MRSESCITYVNRTLNKFRNERRNNVFTTLGRTDHDSHRNVNVGTEHDKALTVIGNVVASATGWRRAPAALNERYTVQLQAMSAGTITFDSSSTGTRATLLVVERPDSKLSKPIRLTPLSREVHLDRFQLRTLLLDFGTRSNSGSDRVSQTT